MKSVLPIFLMLSLLVVPEFGLQAQDAAQDKEDIAFVIKKLFDGMREGDSIKVKSVFHEEVRLSSISEKGKVAQISPQDFASLVGKPHKEIWDERIFDLDINTDGRLASVWCKYAFYLDEKFSHCGTDAFQLVNGGNGWKIIQITDTRNKENCEEHKRKTGK